MAGATAPCSESAATAWTVSLAFGLAWVTANTKGLLAACTSSTGPADRAQIVWTGARRNRHQIGRAHHSGDRLGDGGRRVHDRDLIAGLGERSDLLRAVR